jgi:hypothetical protein
MSRWQASAIHFSISLAVFLVLLAIILLLWYPGILFSIDGGWTGLRIVLGVDLVLGPLLTLVVFKLGKPGLKFDLSCIVFAQVVCMVGGMWIVYQERPIAVVLSYDTFYSLAVQDFEDLGKDSSILDSFSGGYPKMIYIELPENDIQADIANLRSQFIGDPLYLQTENYRTFPQSIEQIKTVFRREESVRSNVEEDLLSELDASCLLSKFVSAVTTGYVCFDPASKSLSGFYTNQYQVE